MSYKTVIQHWYNTSKKDLQVAQGLLRLRHYAYCLFFCHLALEKMLKAVYVSQKKNHAPFIHDLVILANRCSIELSHQQTLDLETITSFNIQGRYAEYKSDFYKTFNKKATAEHYFKITKQFITWLEKNWLKA